MIIRKPIVRYATEKLGFFGFMIVNVPSPLNPNVRFNGVKLINPISLIMNECTAILLAGGIGSRMKQLGRYFCKASLVSYNQTLLLRMIDQLVIAGFRKMIVTTSDRFFPEIVRLVGIYRKEFEERYEGDPVRIDVVNNPRHSIGSLEALHYILESVYTKQCLMCLSDIFYPENPFHEFRNKCVEQTDYFGVSPFFDPCELSMGGIVYCKETTIESILEAPLKDLSPEKAMRWSGLALFDPQEIREEFDEFLQCAPAASPEGDLFEFRRKRGRHIATVPTPDFINVNSEDHLLLVSLLAASKGLGNNPNVSDLTDRLAYELRHSILEQAH